MSSPDSSIQTASEASPADHCANEPIRIPGRIQPHGVLLVLDEKLTIIQVSNNSGRLLGAEPSALLGRSVLSQVDAEAAPMVERMIREARSTFVNPFRVPITAAGKRVEFDGIVHVAEEGGTLLELEIDPALNGAPHAIESLDNYLQVVQRSLNEISETSSTEVIADVIAREVKAFTGFDRVMVYRFAPDFHGHVIAEAVEADMGPFLGLHYPASDIPAQARELYLQNPVRLLQDVDAETCGLTPQDHPITGRPLDMSQAVLRAMSPMHVQYLRNMDVGASLSASLVIDGKLWGLVACHHRTAHFVTYSTRATLSLYAIVMAAQLKTKQNSRENRLIAEARSAALSILTSLRDYSAPLGSLPAMLPRLNELFQAHGGALLTDSEIYRHGSVPEEEILRQLASELGDGMHGGTIVTDHSAKHLPSLAKASGTAAGLVAIHLGHREWLLLFRREAALTVTWAGDPDGAKTIAGDGRLTPRHSFSAWIEEVRGRSEAWPEQTAAITSEVRTGILEILRNRNVLLARSNQDLRRFAGVVAHEVKNHLHTAIMALSLLEEKLAPDSPAAISQLASHGRDRLTDLSKFTNEMLAFAEIETTVPPVPIDLHSLVQQIIKDHEFSGIADEVAIESGPLPSIMGHPSQVRHLMSNLVRNAIVHARLPDRPLRIKIGYHQRTGQDLISVEDNGRGIPANDQARIFEYFYQGSSSGSGSGIGLAFCAQVVERSGHRLWLDRSAPSEGTTFCFSVSKAESSPF